MLDEWARRHGVSVAAMDELRRMFLPPGKSNESGSESRVQSEIRLAAAQSGNTAWRNNSGAVTDDTGRLVRYGLANDSAQLNRVYKSPDLVGVTSITIRPEHVGRTLGVFTAVEVKKPGWTKPTNDRERAQMAFLVDVANRGGLAAFCASVGDYERLIQSVR